MKDRLGYAKIQRSRITGGIGEGIPYHYIIRHRKRVNLNIND